MTGWWTVVTHPSFTLDNYREALTGGSTNSLAQFFINSIVITVPAVMLPILLASLAAYAFAWMHFPGRDTLFVADGSRVYRLLDDDSLAIVDIGSGENQEIGWLDVDHDVLWAFGAGVMSRTADGVNWTAVDVDFPLPWK